MLTHNLPSSFGAILLSVNYVELLWVWLLLLFLILISFCFYWESIADISSDPQSVKKL